MATGASVAFVGPYELRGLLGRGGMGEVYRAFDTRRQRMVALKLLPAALAQDQTFRERFRRESLTAAGLSSPHVVPIHDFGEVAGRLFIDMRLIHGTDLASLLVGGPVAPARAVDIVRQVGDALTDAHQHGVVHRDVKPSNVLLTDTDFVYLVDFGIAHATGHASLTETGTTVGTFGYMAPERLNGTAADARADVYSLACVLHELLVGQRPYAQHTSTPSLIQAHLVEPPPAPSRLNPAVPPGFDLVVARGMAKDPVERYPSVAGLLADLPHLAGAPRSTQPQHEQVMSFAADPSAEHAGPARQQATSVSGAEGTEADVVAGRSSRGSRQMLFVAVGIAAILLVALGALSALWLRPNGSGTPSATGTDTSQPSGGVSPLAVAPLSTASSVAQRYTLRLTGTAKIANINFNVDGSAGSANQAPVPWTRDVDTNSGRTFHLVMLSAFSTPGDPGNLTCSILDQAGRVVSTNTATSLGGQFGTASVNCSGR